MNEEIEIFIITHITKSTENKRNHIKNLIGYQKEPAHIA